jgi:hypothetical protein
MHTLEIAKSVRSTLTSTIHQELLVPLAIEFDLGRRNLEVNNPRIILLVLVPLLSPINCIFTHFNLTSSYVQGLMDQGVPGLIIDSQLIYECEGKENFLIPIAIYSSLHRDILRAQSFETLINMRERIWRDVQVRYSLTKFIRYDHVKIDI